MPPIEGEFACTFLAVPAAVTAARHAVVAFAQRVDAPPLTCENVALAVSEAVTNAVVHGYLEGLEPGEVHVCASLAGDTLHVIVADDGRGMRTPSDGPGPGLGTGLGLIEKISQGLEIGERKSGGVEVRMSFALDVL